MPFVSNKRAILARGLQATGLLGLLERLSVRPGLLVLTYHRIGDPARTSLYAPVVSATPEGFRAQIRRLRKACRVLRLEEVVEAARSGFPLDGPAALVTFDDGTRDNAEVAAPILLAEGVPAAFFLSTGLIDAPGLPWYDHVAAVLNQTSENILRLDRPSPMEIDFTRETRAMAIARVVKSCLDLDIDTHDEAGVLAHLEERAGVSVNSAELGRGLFMSWDDARGLIALGMGIGSHAHSHRKLGALSPDDQAEELRRSKAILEARTGQEVRALAYPYGWPGAFDATTQRLAQEAGYQVAFAAMEGINRPGTTDRFAVRRLNIGSTDSPAMVRARLALRQCLGRSPV